MIYFIKAGDYLKIGYTKNEKTFKVRISTYKTSNPFEIEIINLIEGEVAEERNILNYFIEYHCKGEWFYFEEKIIDFAKNPYKLPESKLLKPLHIGNKKINENISKILELYKEGVSLKELQKRFGIARARITKYIPDNLRREKNEWFKLNRRKISPSNKKILCIETLEEFISLSEASRITGSSKACIGRVCRGERKQTKGYTFKYINN